MAQLLLLNPSKRGTRKMAKKRRTAAQKRATKKLASFNRSRASLNRKRAPARRKARRNPIRYSAPKRNPTRRRKATRTNIVMQTAPVAVTAALGALGLDVVMGYAQNYLPAELQGGPMSAIVKAAGAIGLGVAIKQIPGITAKQSKEVIIGGLTVTLHEQFRMLLEQNAPNVPLGYVDSGMGFYSPAPVTENFG